MDRPAEGEVLFYVAMHASTGDDRDPKFVWDVLEVAETWADASRVFDAYATPTQRDTVIMIRVDNEFRFSVCMAHARSGMCYGKGPYAFLYQQDQLMKAISAATREYTEAVIVPT